VLTTQERWRFESIPNQLVIHFSHKPHSPVKWLIDHQWYFSSKHRGITIMDRTTQGPPDRQELGPSMPLGSLFVPPVLPPSAPVCQPEFILARIVSQASRSKGTLFDQLNMRHTFNMTRGTSNGRSLIDTDRNYKHPRTLSSCITTIPSDLQLSTNTWLFSRYYPFCS
jgi:hypothetical protein